MPKSKIDHVGRVDVFKETKVFDWDAFWGWVLVIVIAGFYLKAAAVNLSNGARTSHPDTFSFGGGKLISNTLCCHFSLKLGEG